MTRDCGASDRRLLTFPHLNIAGCRICRWMTQDSDLDLKTLWCLCPLDRPLGQALTDFHPLVLFRTFVIAKYFPSMK